MSTNAPYTICLSSSDAKHDAENGMFTWSIKSENRKHHVSKVYLASIELPMSQDTIEPAWNRVYFTERLVLGSGRRTLRVRETSQQPASVVEKTATLPMHLNAIVRMNLESRSVGTNVSTYLMFETEHVHGLTHAAFKWARNVQHNQVKIISTSMGDFDILQAFHESRIVIDTATKFGLKFTPEETRKLEAHGPPAFASGYLYFPSPHSPHSLASLVQGVLAEQDEPIDTSRGAKAGNNRIQIDFDTTAVAFVVKLMNYGQTSPQTLRVDIGGDDLAAVMGVQQTSKTFQNQRAHAAVVGYEDTADGNSFLSRQLVGHETDIMSAISADTPPLVLRGNAAKSMFGFAELRKGCYAPAQRTYNTSAPMRMQTEWDLQFSRFLFAPGDSAENKSGLVFTDPVGITRIAVIAVGRYSAATLASFLQQEMNKNSHEGQTFVFSVEFVEGAGDTGSFVFRCSSRDDSSVGMPFAIRFTHPRSIAAERLGFEQMTLEGLDVYESESIHIPRVAMFDKSISNNTYAISEVQGQKRFLIHAMSLPAISCRVVSYDRRFVYVKCYEFESENPVSHGLQTSDVVLLTNDQGDKCTAVCIEQSFEHEQRINSVMLAVSDESWIRTGVVLVMQTAREPCTFCFSSSLERNVGYRLGFENRCVSYGLDGMIKSRDLYTPPFKSPNTHNLDHVDYVLLKLMSCKPSVNVTYETNHRSVPVFAKICLNPTFRNERNLPQETTITGSGRFDDLQIQILNPDLSPYCFNGAAFSLSFTFVP